MVFCVSALPFDETEKIIVPLFSVYPTVSIINKKHQVLKLSSLCYYIVLKEIPPAGS